MSEPAILVDFDTLFASEFLQTFVKAKSEFYEIVLLVGFPTGQNLPKLQELNDKGIEFTAVISNSGRLDNLPFKLKALRAVQNLSTLHPVLIIDREYAVALAFENKGVLLGFNERSLQRGMVDW